MSYLKKSLIIFMLCYYNFLSNENSRKKLKSLVEKTIRKDSNNIEKINDLIDLLMQEPAGIRKNNIDFKEKINISHQNINKQLKDNSKSVVKKIKNSNEV